MRRKKVIVMAIVSLTFFVAMDTVFGRDHFNQAQPRQNAPERPHLVALSNFLTNTRLTFHPMTREAFSYYELRSADRQLTGFVLMGTGEGFGGPLHLFVKTDVRGTIRRVFVWQHEESPEYVEDGMEAFLATFTGLRAQAERRWRRGVDGITGATMTTEAIMVAVRAAGSEAHRRGLFRQQRR